MASSIAAMALAARPAVATRTAAPTAARPAPCTRASVAPFAPAVLRSAVACSAAAAEAPAETSASLPEPVVKIDNTDPFATILSLKYGNELGDLATTTRALKALSLNIKSASFESNEERTKKTFFVTDAETGEKITLSQRLEDIRLTVLECLMEDHPEVKQVLYPTGSAALESFDELAPLGKAKTFAPLPTTLKMEDNPNGRFTKLHIETLDRPGLLVDIVQLLKNMSVNVVAAEVDTVGMLAIDDLVLMYHGEALNDSMKQLITNTMQYHLSKREVSNVESY